MPLSFRQLILGLFSCSLLGCAGPIANEARAPGSIASPVVSVVVTKSRRIADIAPAPASDDMRPFKVPRIEALEAPGGFDYWMDRIQSGKTKVFVAP